MKLTSIFILIYWKPWGLWGGGANGEVKEENSKYLILVPSNLILSYLKHS